MHLTVYSPYYEFDSASNVHSLNPARLRKSTMEFAQSCDANCLSSMEPGEVWEESQGEIESLSPLKKAQYYYILHLAALPAEEIIDSED